jgi:adenylate cyclase
MADRPNVQRRLAAILAADAFGYSRLMEADEERTLAQIKAQRRHLVDPKFKQHRDRKPMLWCDARTMQARRRD